MSQRPKKNFLNLPEELQLEVDWIKEHVSDFEDLNVGTFCRWCFKKFD